MRFSTRTIGDNVRNAVKGVTVESTTDDPLLREASVRLFTDEKQNDIEHFEPYGMTARVKKPTGQGKNRQTAEGLMIFESGNRTHGTIVQTADRRYRVKGIKEGEVVFFDDQGQQAHFTRDGIIVSAPNGKKIITQIMESEKMPEPETGEGAARKLGQGIQAKKKAYATVVLTKDSLEVTHPKKIVHKVGSSTITMEPSKVTIESPSVVNKVTQKFVTVGVTRLGLDNENESAPRVETEAGPAKQTYAKVE